MNMKQTRKEKEGVTQDMSIETCVLSTLPLNKSKKNYLLMNMKQTKKEKEGVTQDMSIETCVLSTLPEISIEICLLVSV
jgi:hypothetical protein